MVKPAPLIEAAVMETGAVPELDNVTGVALLLPTITFPKLMLDGLAARDPWVPIPVKPMAVGEPDELLVKVIFPGTLPAAVGLNVTAKEVFAPGLIVTGAVRFML
jgi:hypothetical protein